MARRYGRNQKRKAAEQRSALEAKVSQQAAQMEQNARDAKSYIEHLRYNQKQDILAARMARNTIRLDIDSLIDPREGNINIAGRMHMMMADSPIRGYEPLHVAVNISERDMQRRSDAEREAFIAAMGQKFSEYALAQIMRHWRSR